MSDKETIEAEVVPTQAVAVRQQAGGLATVADLEQSFALAVRQRELLSEYIRKQLKPGKHFYQRGDQKPSLSKEGAEIILLPHNLAPDYEWVSGPESPPEGDAPYQITIKCVLRAKGNPQSFVGSGIGSAGSHKGYWRKQGKESVWDYQPRQTDRFLCHNATIKMAQKSAMIAATINSTAASEFFTQDMDESGGAEVCNPPPARPVAKPHPNLPTSNTRAWMLKELKAEEPGHARLLREYFEKLGQLLTSEKLEDLPLRFVPASRKELEALVSCVGNFEAGGDAVAAFEPHTEADAPKPKNSGRKPAPRESSPKESEASGEPWYPIVVPVPHKGEKRDEYLKHPDTIGSLYEARHDDDEARKRLWGFLNHYEPKGWTKRDGTQMPPSKSDIQFREALDQFQEWFEENHPDEKI